MSVVENSGPASLFSDVNSLRQHLDNARSLGQIEEVVLEAGTLVGEGRMPKLAAVLLVCYAQIQLTLLKYKQ